jgi:hypothetical protein
MIEAIGALFSAGPPVHAIEQAMIRTASGVDSPREARTGGDRDD